MEIDGCNFAVADVQVVMLCHPLVALSQIRPRPALLFACPVTFVESMEEKLSIESLGHF